MPERWPPSEVGTPTTAMAEDTDRGYRNNTWHAVATPAATLARPGSGIIS